MTDLHRESLDNNQQEVFEQLRHFANVGILAGGTAIALQIGHRKSYDFDIFTFEPLKKSLMQKIKRVFGNGALKTYDTEEQLNVSVPGNVKVTFYYEGYGPSVDTIKTGSIDLLDLRDLASNKALTIGSRGKWRDYVDLYFLIKDGWVTLESVITMAEHRYGGEFSRKLFLEQLAYTGDITNFSISFIGQSHTPQEIAEYLESQVKEYVTSTLLATT